ncbi:MAG: PRD domain-containing protein [Oscillospiraceae bacterium]
MNYMINKVFNNNVVLAQEHGGKQVVLISKGIGFSIKKGQEITCDGRDKKVFHILDESEIYTNKVSYDIEKVKVATSEIVQIAREKLGITSDKLYDALYDHISFALERLNRGLPIDNPFIDEIAIMCSCECEVADIAATIIKDQIEVNIGEAEKGFIALHLYSVRKNKHINVAIKGARVYKKAVDMVGEKFGKEFDASSSAYKIFLMTLNRLINASVKKKLIEMPIKEYVKLQMPTYYKLAQEISEIIQEELDIDFSDDAEAFLAVNICKFVQI